MSITTTTTSSPLPTKLTPDDIDDLIYACRTNALDWLTEMLSTWSKQLNTSEAEVIRSAIDVDEEGNGSRACLLHYPAANGDVKLVEYLLGKLGEGEVKQEQEQVNGHAGESLTETKTEQNQDRGTSFVNHQNESGNTPLHWAALNGHLEVVKALVKAGADPTIVNAAGKDAVVEAEYSAKEKALECAEWLLKECESLEKGAGGFHADEGVAGDEGEDGDEDTKDEEKPVVNGNH